MIFNRHDLLYVFCKRFFLNLKGLCDGKVVSLTKKEYGSGYDGYGFYKIFKVNI